MSTVQNDLHYKKQAVSGVHPDRFRAFESRYGEILSLHRPVPVEENGSCTPDHPFSSSNSHAQVRSMSFLYDNIDPAKSAAEDRKAAAVKAAAKKGAEKKASAKELLEKQIEAGAGNLFDTTV